VNQRSDHTTRPVTVAGFACRGIHDRRHVGMMLWLLRDNQGEKARLDQASAFPAASPINRRKW
jgi:hypothetical protein